MMFIVVDNFFDPPSHRKSGNRKRQVFERATHHHDYKKLFRFPGFNLRLALFSIRWKDQKIEQHQYTYHLNRISTPKPFNLPLLIIRYVKHRRRIPTHERPSLPEIVEGTTTYFPRVYVDVEEYLGVDTLDLVDDWLWEP